MRTKIKQNMKRRQRFLISSTFFLDFVIVEFERKQNIEDFFSYQFRVIFSVLTSMRFFFSNRCASSKKKKEKLFHQEYQRRK